MAIPPAIDNERAPVALIRPILNSSDRRISAHTQETWFLPCSRMHCFRYCATRLVAFVVFSVDRPQLYTLAEKAA